MEVSTTSGIKISVRTAYSEEHSDYADYHFMFTYDVRIENLNPFPVKLLSRKWLVFDSCNEYRTYEGEGVIGVQPEIPPKGWFSYQSGCNLFTERGSMKGKYQMLNLLTGEEFEAQIPPFNLEIPFLFN